jgi:hypothetical protein
MSEATEFFGVVERVSPSSTRPFRWRRRKDPEAGAVKYYPVFTSREGAKTFLRAVGHPSLYDVAIGSQGEELLTDAPPLQHMLADIRAVEHSEIPLDHRVLRDPVYGQDVPAFATWADILAEGE